MILSVPRLFFFIDNFYLICMGRYFENRDLKNPIRP